MKNIPDYKSFKSVTEGGGYTKVQDELEELIKNMSKRAYDGFAGEYDIDPEDAAEMMGFITDIPDKDAKRVIKDIKKGLYESVNEAMAYKKAQQFTKKLNDDALLQDLLYVAKKIHDKMGNKDDVQEWLKTVITYGNEHPQQWSESLDEAAPKMTVDPDAEYVSDVINRLGVIGRNATGSNVQKDITKALKVLQNLRSSIQVGR